MKTNVNPDDVLAQMASRQNNSNANSKPAAASRIGGGLQKPTAAMNRPQSSANRQEPIQPQQNNFMSAQTQNFSKNADFDQS